MDCNRVDIDWRMAWKVEGGRITKIEFAFRITDSPRNVGIAKFFARMVRRSSDNTEISAI